MYWRKKLKLVYKYYGFEAGLMALKHKSLGFNIPSQFNDPMEGRLWLHQIGVEASFLDTYLENFGILCLTQDPLNPLMWSHYGQNHTGFAIGYDVNDPILGPQRDSVFNLEDGQIFFTPDFSATNIRDDALAALQWAAFGMEAPRCEKIDHILRHIFLMKQKCWGYEKEIRVVKLLYNLGMEQHEWVAQTGNNFQRLSTPIAPMQSMSNSSLSLLTVAENTIKHVILGMKNPLLKSGTEVFADKHLSYLSEAQIVEVAHTTWSDDGHSLEAVKAIIPTWGNRNSISTKYLSHSELEAISKKWPLADDSKKPGMRLTKWLNGNVEVFWDHEI